MEEIPDTHYWIKEYRYGVDDYVLSDLKEKLSFDRKLYDKQKKELEESTNWKFIKPKNDGTHIKKCKEIQNEKDEIIRKQLKWEEEERKIIIKCNFLGIKYIQYDIFPSNYETSRERKLNFPLNYRWIDNISKKKETEYYSVWVTWLRDDCTRRLKLDNKIKEEENKLLKSRKTEKWYQIPEEIRCQIIEKREQTLKKYKKESRSCRSYVPETTGYITAPNGMTIEISVNNSKEKNDELKQELKQAMKDY